MDLRPADVTKLCRTCLQSGAVLVSIHSHIDNCGDRERKSVADLLRIYAKLSLTDNDLPDKICLTCLNVIQFFHEFLMKCEKSEQMFLQWKTVEISSEIVGIKSELDSESDSQSRFDDSSQMKTELNECDEDSRSEFAIDTSGQTSDPLEENFSEVIYLEENQLSPKFIKVEKCGTSKTPPPLLNIREEPELIDEDEMEYSGEDKLPVSSKRKFECPKCSHTCRSLVLLHKHVLKHMTNSFCTICSKDFTSNVNDHCTEHLGKRLKDISSDSNSTTDTKKFDCFVCSRRFLLQNDYETHVKRHGAVLFKCKKCSKAFRSQYPLMVHTIREHIDNTSKQIQCELCSKLFDSKDRLIAHIRTHSMMKCMICSTEFHQKRCLKNHLTVIHGVDIIVGNETNTEYKCVKCSERFRDIDDFEHHNCPKQDAGSDDIQLKHDHKTPIDLLKNKIITSNESSVSSFPSAKLLICEFCWQTYQSESLLRRHQSQSHPKLTPKYLETIKKVSQQLEDHTEKHSVQCDICLKPFSRKQYLERHKKAIHSVDVKIRRKQITCMTCSKNFRSDKEMIEHIKQHKLDRLMKCD